MVALHGFVGDPVFILSATTVTLNCDINRSESFLPVRLVEQFTRFQDGVTHRFPNYFDGYPMLFLLADLAFPCYERRVFVGLRFRFDANSIPAMVICIEQYIVLAARGASGIYYEEVLAIPFSGSWPRGTFFLKKGVSC